MDFIYIIVGLIQGLVLGVLMGFFAGKSKYSPLAMLLEREKVAREEERRDFKEQLETTKKESAEQLESVKKESAEQLESVKKESAEQLESAKKEAAEQLETAKKEAAERRASELEEIKRDYIQQLDLFKENVKTTTEKILKERSEELQGVNMRQMDSILTPLRENIGRMEASMNENRDVHNQNTASLKDAIKNMMEKTADIGVQADRLSNALQHKNKFMGNWGEMILINILESQGFHEGVEFESQKAMRDEDGHVLYNEESGSKMIPDVILHLPDNRDLIIDAKMSLTAFVDYQNAINDAERDEAAMRHIESVKAHVKELSQKNYSKYIKKPRVSSDFVIMFLPQEGAMQLIMEREPELWTRAFEKDHVYIISGQYLMAAVHLINISWHHVQQEKNTQEILKNARILVERVELFYSRFLNLGKKLDETKKAYEEIDMTVRTGKQSIAASGRVFAKLGVPSKNILPEPEAEAEQLLETETSSEQFLKTETLSEQFLKP